jgi:peptidoglycan/xylan/chitin deacetylase (PgdA/CDA1 family)/glycosyltransferase involved in cell wall biosynthesis/SAM-dependent methyltransferase
MAAAPGRALVSNGRIAAIVTCRDLGRYLAEALESVERQTRPASEIVVVDDRSSDVHTRQVLAALRRAGTCVVEGEGRGASAARNQGARLTTSDYLVWLDADDVLEPAYFADAAARLDADASIHFVSCAMRGFGAASYVWRPSAPEFVEAVASGGVPHASTMVRRAVWQQTGGFDETLASFELLDFWATVLERGFAGVVLDEPLLNYRIRRGSGYRRSIQQDTYLERLEHFYAKHRSAIEKHAVALLRHKEVFLEGQRAYRRSLEERTAALQAELATLRAEIAALVRTIEANGDGRVRWGDLRRISPLSDRWGKDRGTPIDRRYVEGFLERHRSDIGGRVLEVRGSEYARRFGTAVTGHDVVDIDPTNQQATIIADLRRADSIPSNTYDCIVLTQTLQLVDDIEAAIAECARILKPGGVLLVTAPTLIRVDDEGGLDGDFWRLTEASARRLFSAAFPVDAFEVTSYGNVLAATSFLYGISMEELTPGELDAVDPDYPVIVGVRAVKPIAPRRRAAVGSRDGAGVVLVYHRIAELTPDSHHLCTPPVAFRSQMACLRDHWTPMALEELIEAAAAGDIPDRAVAVTLDDGYLDALTTASPILEATGVPATFFVNTDNLDVEHERWWDVLERLFLGEGVQQTTGLPPLLTVTVAGHPFEISTATDRDRRAALDLLNQIAWPLDAAVRTQLLHDVCRWSGTATPVRASHRVLTGAEILQLASRPGHAVGDHTVHHLALSKHGAAAQCTEIVESKRAIERLLGKPVTLFSYPYGDYDGNTVAAVRDAGFLGAVTVEAGAIAAGANRLLLPRVEVSARTAAEFEAGLVDMFGRCAV